MAETSDDGFELYDLRVEVIVPEGGAIYCGAKAGDYFEMRGEMIHLPQGQGFWEHLSAQVVSGSLMLPARGVAILEAQEQVQEH